MKEDLSPFFQIDLHHVAGTHLGLVRPGGSSGNYRSPHHKDKSPSLSIFHKGQQWGWKDHSSGDGGNIFGLVQYVNDVDFVTALNQLRDWYGIPRPVSTTQPVHRKRTTVEYIADRCRDQPDLCIPYLRDKRQLPEAIIKQALSAGSVGFNRWTSPKKQPGEGGYGGDAVAFITRSLQSGLVVAVDTRYLDPELNGGQKSSSQGQKDNAPWCSDLNRLKRARRVYIVESAINALCVDACELPYTAAVATRGTEVEHDWRFLKGKEVYMCMDWDAVTDKGKRPGPEAAYRIHSALTALDIPVHLVDQREWEAGWDINDYLMHTSLSELSIALKRLDSWLIPGQPGSDQTMLEGERPRVYLPNHDSTVYWRYRTRTDFTLVIKTRTDQETGEEQEIPTDLAGFRIAGISRVTIAGAVSVLSGATDNQPVTQYSVSIQGPDDAYQLHRTVMTRQQLFNAEQWKKLGPVFSPNQFLRMIGILARAAQIGARSAMNFVGLGWLDGQLRLNEGKDTYFTNPEQQCPYHNLLFPSGPIHQATAVVNAYQQTFADNAATILLVWSLGGHLKPFLGFWPHFILQAEKATGKTTLIKRLERTIGFTMMAGESMKTAFRLLTSVSCTTHPVGWEEISAKKQELINSAVELLQESYNYSATRRGAEMTEYVICAPVLLAGEDVPVKSLLSKVVRSQLSRDRQGPMLPDNLPAFPVREWLQFLTTVPRNRLREVYQQSLNTCREKSIDRGHDAGSDRLLENYAAIITCWLYLSEFAGFDPLQGGFIPSVIDEMNLHIKETSGDRQPWVWILDMIFAEISSEQFKFPHVFEEVAVNGLPRPCLLLRTNHIMAHFSGTSSLRDKWNASPVKSDRVLKRQLKQAGVLASDRASATINKRRVEHMVALDLEALEAYGLSVSQPALV